ncbi:MAG: hypothetical protein AAF581_02295 [Planctomycetota bacterium]
MWNRSYQVDDVSRGVAVRQANDDPNGYIMLGHTQTLTGDGAAPFIMRTDTNGNPVWTKVYGRSLGRSFFPEGEIRSCGSGYIIAGSVNSPAEGGELGYLLRINDTGVTQWMNFYSQDGEPFNFTGFNDVLHTATGFVATGKCVTTVPPGMFQNTTDTLLITFDSLGAPIWAKQYPYIEGEDSGQSVALTSSGYAVVGTQEAFGFPAAQLFSTDALGNLNWFRRVETFIDGGYGIQDSPANGTLHVMSNGDLVFPGGNLFQNTSLLQFDSLGTLLTAQEYGASTWQFGSSSLIEPGETGYTFVGPISDGITLDYYLVRADANFITNCNDRLFFPTITTPPVTPATVNYTATAVLGEQAVTPTEAPLVWIEETYCATSPCIESVPVTCSLSGLSVDLTWPPLPAAVASAELWRNGSFLSFVTGTSYTDASPPFGTNSYERASSTSVRSAHTPARSVRRSWVSRSSGRSSPTC